MTEQSRLDLVRSLKKHSADKTGLQERYDDYFFLARIGSNYWDYSFGWEPFRDLAGPLEAGVDALPVVILSDDRNRHKPEVVKVEQPVPHFQFWVSPSCPVASIANEWLELLARNHAMHTRYKGPFDWFLRQLGLRPEDLSKKSRDFIFM